MPETPKVSIITVCFNSEQTIEDTIQSVIHQDYSKIEYIILDGKSTDKTIDKVKSYGDKIDVFKSESDKGMYDALNKAIDLCTGEIIAILNSDDVYADEKVISDVVNVMVRDKTDAVYADLVYVDKNNLDKVTRIWKSGKYSRNSFLYGWMPPHPTFFVKKEVYEKHGKFNIELVSAADYELMLRLLHKYDVNTSYLPRVIVKMREGGLSNQSLYNRIRANKEDRLAWEINQLKPLPFTMLIKPIRKVGQFFVKTKRRTF